MGTVFDQIFNMKVIVAFALFIVVASQISVPSPTCEQKNVVLKDALLKLAKEKMANADCGTCYGDISSAAGDCFFSLTPVLCIRDILGASNPCTQCVCEVI